MTNSTESQTDSSEKMSESGMMRKDSTVLGRGSDAGLPKCGMSD
jgi:hypothetical protein